MTGQRQIKDCIFLLRDHKDKSKVGQFACDMADHVVNIYEARNDDARIRECIKVARLYHKGRASKEELNIAYKNGLSAWTDAREKWYNDRDNLCTVMWSAKTALCAVSIYDGYVERVQNYAVMAAGDTEIEWQQELFTKYFCTDSGS